MTVENKYAILEKNIHYSVKIGMKNGVNNMFFSKDFLFNEFSFSAQRHNDASVGNRMHYIGYLHEGSARVEYDDKIINIPEGSFSYLPKAIGSHSYWFVGKNGVVRFDSYGFRRIPKADNISYPFQKIDPFEEALEINRKLTKDKNLSCRSVGLFYELLGVLLEKMECVSESKKSALVQKAEDFMRENTSFSVGDIARYCGVSESGLYNAFKSEKGITPVVAKHKILTERARELLTTTDMSVENISIELGFGTAAYFRKVFTQVTGKTPREVRKESPF